VLAAAITSLPSSFTVAKSVSEASDASKTNIDGGTVNEGDTLNYTVRVTASGPNVGPITITDPLSSYLTYTSGNNVTVSVNGAAKTNITPTVTTTGGSQTLTIATGQTLVNSGDWLEISFPVTVKAGSAPNVITNTATASANGYTNDSNTTQVTIIKPIALTTLTVSKTVTGSTADPTRDFSFKVSFFQNAAGTTPWAPGQPLSYTGGSIITGVSAPANGTLTLVNGAATFTLKHGQSITIAGIPEGTYIEVAEVADSQYSTSFTESWSAGSTTGIDTGRVALNAAGTVAFTNAKNMVPDTALAMGNHQALLPLFMAVDIVVSAGLVLLMMLVRRRRKNKPLA